MPDNKTSLPKQSNKEVGVSGTLMYQGIITDEDYNKNLTGPRGYKQFDIMRRSDASIRQMLQVYKLPVLSTTWKISPAKQPDGTVTPAAQKHADFIKDQLFHRNINFNDFMRESLGMLDFGFSVFEKVFEPVTYDGMVMIGLKKLASRKQKTVFAWQTKTGEPGITQISGADNIDIPLVKLVVFTFDKEGENYEGTSLLRYAYKDWDMKDKLVLVNAMALERHGMGIPMAQAREGQSPTTEDLAAAEEVLSNIRANERSRILAPNTMDIMMMDMKSGTTKEVIPTLNYHDSRIAKSILAGFLEIGGASGSGSQALSKDLSALFMKSEEALAKTVKAVINDQIIKHLCDINFSDMQDGYPELDYGQIADDDTSAVADSIQKLASAGVLTPDIELEDHVRGTLRLPLMSQESKDKYDEKHAVATPIATPIAPQDVNAALDIARDARARLLGALAQG